MRAESAKRTGEERKSRTNLGLVLLVRDLQSLELSSFEGSELTSFELELLGVPDDFGGLIPEGLFEIEDPR